MNVADLGRCFPRVGDVSPEALVGAGLVSAPASRCVKILGGGELAAGLALTVRAHAFSRSAIDKIQAAGGRTEVIPA